MTQAQAYQPLPDGGLTATNWALTVMFGERKDDAWVATVTDVNSEDGQWRGGRYRNMATAFKTAAKAGHYVNTTIIRPDRHRRTDACAESVAFIFADDVGGMPANPTAKISKDWLDLVGPTPTLMVETSASNFQYFYVFDEPAELGAARALVRMLKAKEDTRGGFGQSGEITRYGRLPSGVNPKEGRGGFATRLVDASGIKYSPQALADGFGLGEIRLIEPDFEATADECPLEEIRRLCLGPNAPLSNADLERFPNRADYVAMIHHIKGASGGTDEGYAIAAEWATLQPQSDKDASERIWDSIHSPRTGASALWEVARKKDSLATTILWFELHPGTPEPEPEPEPENTLPKLIPVRFICGGVLPPREFLVKDGWIPMRKVTLLQGDGGDGKTLLLHQLQASCATGLPWIGLEVTECASVGFYTEDDEYDAKERQQAIDAHYGRFCAGDDRMRVFTRDGRENELVVFDRNRKAFVTPFYKQVQETALDAKARLLALDVAVDMYGGNEIVRTEVRAMFRALKVLARKMDGAVVMSMHVSQSGIRTDGGHSGSTDWSNAARSRLYLNRPDDQTDPNARVLTRKKANYAAIGDRLDLRWSAGVLMRDGQELASRPQATQVFLEILDAMTREGQAVSSVLMGNYAPRLFARRPPQERRGYQREDFERASCSGCFRPAKSDARSMCMIAKRERNWCGCNRNKGCASCAS